MTIKCPKCFKILDNKGFNLKYEICTSCVAGGALAEKDPKDPRSGAPMPSPAERRAQFTPKVECFYEWIGKYPEQKLFLTILASTKHLKKDRDLQMGLGFGQIKEFYKEMKLLHEKGPPKQDEEPDKKQDKPEKEGNQPPGDS